MNIISNILIFILPFVSFGQLNMITNGSFEIPNTCIEMNAKCAPSAWFLVSGTLPVYDFDNIGIITANSSKKNVRQYLQQQLIGELVKDKVYHFSMTIWGNDIPSLGILFSSKLECSDFDKLLDLNPTIDLTKEIDLKKFFHSKKVKIEYDYLATGTEKFIIIGNFQKDSDQIRKSKDVKPFQNYYIHIDDVSLIDKNEKESNSTQMRRMYLTDYRLRHSGCAYIPFDVENLQKTIEKEQELNFQLNTNITIDDILFETNSYLIDSIDVEKIKVKLIGIPKDSIKTIIIEGHTDSLGEEESNLVLSQKRAESVKEILLNLGFDFDKISAVGKGEFEPKYDNSTEEGRGRNRRIELFFEY